MGASIWDGVIDLCPTRLQSQKQHAGGGLTVYIKITPDANTLPLGNSPL